MLCQVLSCRRPQAAFPGSWTEARCEREVPRFWDRIFSVGGSKRRRVGQGWRSGGVRRSLGAAGGGVQKADSRFLGRFVEDVDHHVAPAHGQTAAWSLKRSRTWPHKRHCVSWAKNGMRRRCCRAVWIRRGLVKAKSEEQGSQGSPGWTALLLRTLYGPNRTILSFE